MFDQRTLFNFDIPVGMIQRPGSCPKCGSTTPFHAWNCGMDLQQKKDFLELIRSTGSCGQMECGKIITETCRNCDRFTLKEEKEGVSS